jgi:opacity protein-like surface antigen
MKKILFFAVLLTSMSASAALRSRLAESDEENSPLEGVYAALGGGGGLNVIGGENDFGYDLEARLGYSFGPQLSVYLSGAVDGASTKATAVAASQTYRVEQFTVMLQYHLVVKAKAMVYVRGGIGVGMSNSTVLSPDGSNAVGLAGSGGIGVEIRLAPNLFLSPELFYRNATLNGNTGVQVIGLQLALAYY